MFIIYSPKHKQHNPKYELYDMNKSVYVEIPERIELIARALRKERIGNFIAPRVFPISFIEKIHKKNYISFLKNKSRLLRVSDNFFPSYHITDTYAPVTKGTYRAAKLAVDVTLTGAELLKNGEKSVYSLCRPPGHHAGYATMGGYCYFNNAAIAANYLSQFGTVAILDIDYHHGNGTQQTFYKRNDVLYISIHADPAQKYPYITGFAEENGIAEGHGYNKNYPLPIHATEALYRKTLKSALLDINRFQPKFLIVSAGFDTYRKDPIGTFKLTIPFYQEIGSSIASLRFPTHIIQEGGYYIKDLGRIVMSFLSAFQN